MELNVAEAIKRVGEPFSFSLTEAVPAETFGQRRVDFAEELHITGTYVFDGSGFTLAAVADTALNSVCARCEAAFVEHITFPVNERFSKACDPENDEMYPYAGDRIDLMRAVLDNLYLHLPLASLCREDCKGLCPVCGADRNRTECNCQAAQRPGPFAALAPLIDEE